MFRDLRDRGREESRDELFAPAHANLGACAVEMFDDGIRRDAERRGDGLRRFAADDRRDHLSLSRRQMIRIEKQLELAHHAAARADAAIMPATRSASRPTPCTIADDIA